MECNKEEAIRAKGIAENKMLNKDFIGARKIVLKAQQLYPDLENVPQMLTVCDVHCSAEVKVNGEMDWYGILQVAPAADEITIKKQYRKLALLLHPDKNKYGGAEAAFKLVGEAHRTLTDRSKRALHDMKRGASFRTVAARQPAPQANRTSYTKKQTGVASSFANSTSTQSNGFNQQQQAAFSSSNTFWTMCPSCGIRYQYYQTIMNKQLRCQSQSCKKPFVAYDLNAHTVPSAAPWNRTGIPQQEKRGPAAHFTGQQSSFGTGSNLGPQGNADGGSAASQPWSRPGFNTEFGGTSNESKEDVKVDRDGGTANDVKFEKVKLPEINKKGQAVKSPAGNRSQKRGRKITLESSESESSDSDMVVEDGRPSGQNTGSAGSNPRRSSRQKQSISYNEEKSDDDDFVTLKNKKSRMGGTSLSAGQNDPKYFGEDANDVNETAASAGATSKASASVDFSSEASPDPDSFSYPDPEFYDFDEERVERKFAVDQVWAIYDNLDAMPRYYALIRRVYGGQKFRLRFNWLEYDPTGKAETLWYKGDLPIGSGSFKLGKAEQTEERLMFSHLMPWRNGTKKNTFDIFPRKGEVWALFKNWDIEWSSCVDNDRQYEYEIVEVVSDFTEGDMINVVRLVRIHGFVSLFVQATDQRSSPLKIQMKDVLQFSHKIPSYRLKGNEREGIPKGSLELDTASLPHNFAEMFPSVSLEDLNNVCNGLHSKSAGKEDVPTCTANNSSSELHGIPVEELQRSSCQGNGTCKEPNRSSSTEHAAGGSQNHVQSEQKTCKQQIGAKDNTDARDPITNEAAMHHNDSQPPSSPNWYEYPDSEFHNFEEERSTDKFVEGQIWAIYSDVDKHPNYYGRISKVEKTTFRVHVTWLEGYTDEEHEKGWYKRQLPIGCGPFKTIREGCVLDTTDTFSHMVQAIPTMRKNHYLIYPHVGEIWAVYKNWSLEWSLSDMEDCEFDLVEILAATSSGFKVMMLSKVMGYRAVFLGERIGDSTKTIDIPIAERWKFSYKIPAFKLTEERGGKLRGYWELDPASVPDVMLFTDSN